MWVWDLGPGIRDPEKKLIPDPGSCPMLTVLNSWWAERTPSQTEGRHTRAGRSHHSQFQVSRTFFRFHHNFKPLSWTKVIQREALWPNETHLYLVQTSNNPVIDSFSSFIFSPSLHVGPRMWKKFKNIQKWTLFWKGAEILNFDWYVCFTIWAYLLLLCTIHRVECIFKPPFQIYPKLHQRSGGLVDN